VRGLGRGMSLQFPLDMAVMSKKATYWGLRSAGGEKLSQAQMQLFELEPVVSEMIEQAESEHAPLHRRPRNPLSIRVARSCRRIFIALSGFCPAH
jgi:hypothetical protein